MSFDDVAYVRALVVDAGPTDDEGGGGRLVLRLFDDAPPPYAPAELRDADGGRVDAERVTELDGDRLHLRTAAAPPHGWAGRTVSLHPRWTAHAAAVVADLDTVWALEAAPDGRTPCLLDGTTLQPGSTVSQGWRSGEDWLCPACHQRYVVEDAAAVRSWSPPAGSSSGIDGTGRLRTPGEEPPGTDMMSLLLRLGRYRRSSPGARALVDVATTCVGLLAWTAAAYVIAQESAKAAVDGDATSTFVALVVVGVIVAVGLFVWDRRA